MVKDIIINITYCGLVPWGFANNGELPENALAAKRGTADLPAVKAVAGAMSEAASMAIFMVNLMTKEAESERSLVGSEKIFLAYMWNLVSPLPFSPLIIFELIEAPK